MEKQTQWMIGGSIAAAIVAVYFSYQYGLKQGTIVGLTSSGKGVGVGTPTPTPTPITTPITTVSGSGKGVSSGTNTVPTPTVNPSTSTIDAAFNLAFSRIKLMPFYQQSSATEKFLMDNTMTLIGSNPQVKQEIKAYADANNVPIENAIVTQLIPKK